MCPLAVAVAHPQPTDGLFASSQRRSRSDRTRGLKGSIRRAAFEQRRASQMRRKLVIISDVPRPNYENDPEFDPVGPIVHEWHMAAGGVLERMCIISPGMTVAEADPRLFGKCSKMP
jgi:hypothetical protein